MNQENFNIAEVDEKTEKKLLGIRGIFLKGEKRQAVLTSKLVNQAIKKKKKSGEKLSQTEIDKIKFAFDPIFKQKVIDKVHSDCDKAYNQAIKKCENNIKSLEKSKANEIKRIEESRWENIVNKNLRYNVTEGKLLMNNATFLFSSIKGAAVNINESYRVETEQKGQSKKHASVGGAVVGTLMFGAVGGIVGGSALGKTTHNSTTNTNNIPTANHVGVIVDIDGFKSEIVLLSQTVDQDSREFQNAIKNAQEIITKLQYLSSLPVPETFLKVEEEQSVVDLQNQIINAIGDLEVAKANVPTYDIPEKYL